MTVLHSRGKQYEWTLLIDAFNNEILAHQVSDRPGDSRPYYHVLNELIKLSLTKKEKTAPIVFHSDQGAVFSSRAFFKAHEQYTIQRSMSRIGTPTDNPVIEALNGWIKEELLTDFGLSDTSDVKKLLDEYLKAKKAVDAIEYEAPAKYAKVLPADKVAKLVLSEERFRHQQIGRLGGGNRPGGPGEHRPHQGGSGKGQRN